ncbi:MAG: hypothetical protein ACOCM5_05260, partial [Prevotella pectinovora]
RSNDFTLTEISKKSQSQVSGWDFFVGFPEYRFIPFCLKIEDKTKAFLLTSAPSRAKTHNDINPS